jgi:ABC-type transport system substrate-binding protein
LFAGTALAQVAQILQQEWAAVGVHITIDQSQNPTVDYFVRHVAPLNVGSGAAAGDYGPVNQYIPGNLGDVCSYSDPAITAQYGELAALDPRSAQAISAARQLQDIAYKDGLMVYIVNADFPVAYDAKVRNLVANPYYTNYFMLDYWSGLGVTK